MKNKKLLIQTLVGTTTIFPVATIVGCSNSNFQIVKKEVFARATTDTFIDHILCRLYLKINDWEHDWAKTEVNSVEQTVEGWSINAYHEEEDKRVWVALMYDVDGLLPDPLPTFDYNFNIELTFVDDPNVNTKYVFHLDTTFGKEQTFSTNIYDIPFEFKTFDLVLKSKE